MVWILVKQRRFSLDKGSSRHFYFHVFPFFLFISPPLRILYKIIFYAQTHESVNISSLSPAERPSVINFARLRRRRVNKSAPDQKHSNNRERPACFLQSRPSSSAIDQNQRSDVFIFSPERSQTPRTNMCVCSSTAEAAGIALISCKKVMKLDGLVCLMLLSRAFHQQTRQTLQIERTAEWRKNKTDALWHFAI
jgi:hypothetical protein